MSSNDLHLDLAGHLAGSLDEQERARFDQHLRECESCREELESLRPLVEALAASEPLQEPPPELKGRVIAEVLSGSVTGGSGAVANATSHGAGPSRGEHSRSDGQARFGGRGSRRPSRALLGVLAAVLVAGAVAVSLLLSGGSRADYVATLSSPELGGQIDVSIRADDGGHQVEVEGDSVRRAANGDFYELWFVGADDSSGSSDRISAGSFSVSDDGSFDAILSTAIDPADYPRIELTAEAADGDPRPTPPPLASASLAS